MHAYLDKGGTLDHARALWESVATSRAQSAGVLAGLAALATTHPVAGVASALAGGAFMLNRPKPAATDLLGHDRAAVARMDAGFSLTLGHQFRTGEPIVLSQDEARQHLLVLGTTGSGKSEFLLGLSDGAISQGGGVLYVDGKGDVSIFAKMWDVARRNNRQDDLLVLNLMSAAGNGLASNTMDPFAGRSSDSLVQLLVGLMGEGGGPDARGLATAMLVGVMRSLVERRDKGELVLDAATVRDHLSLEAVLALLDSGQASPEVSVAVSNYLGMLPGYNPERGTQQARSVSDRHGFVRGLLCGTLDILAGSLSHVFKGSLADIDMRDVVANRRILVVLMPALEKSGDDVARLGKVVLATLKGLMGAALGETNRGSWTEVVGLQSRNDAPPFMCVLDEIGFYAVEGTALMAAQARSLNFCMVYGTQDIPAMMRLNEREAASIVANTNTKIFMRCEDVSTHEMSGTIRRSLGMSSDHWAELGTLCAGEMLVSFKGELVFGRGVALDWERGERVGRLRPNRFVCMA